jgi:hypothetical protein
MKAIDLPLSRTISVGGIKVHALEAGVQWLDGGAMFGVVPRPLWERAIPPDERHRIPLALRCLLVEAPNALVLVDSGVGAKESAKFRDIYGVDNPGSPTRLEDALGSLDVGLGEHDHELLTAVPGGDVHLAQVLSDDVRDSTQHAVTVRVTVTVVELLEVVDV